MKTPTKGKRLARRYPILQSVPEEERAAVVRAALRHPLLLCGLAGLGLFVLPRYFDWIFAALSMGGEENMTLFIAKMGASVLLPLLVAVPLLTRFVMPALIRGEMKKRGFL